MWSHHLDETKWFETQCGGCTPRASSAASATRCPLLLLFFITLKFSAAKVFEPDIRALLGTAAHLCEAVVLKLGTAP